jgi:hypothetical protein
MNTAKTTLASVGAGEELAFIRDTMEGKLDLSAFNDDWACFSRYCTMQANTMSRAGFAAHADIAYAYANRAARKATGA